MFKVGQDYSFEILDERDSNNHPDVTTYPLRRVVSVDGPLVEFEDGDGTIIVNTYSLLFVRAKSISPKLKPG